MIDEKLIGAVLKKCWSIKSSSLWTEDNPAKGQCGVTALVINYFFGGEILKTRISSGQFHFYNFINGQRFDFTSSQFENEINYDDIVSTREEAFGDTNEEQYFYLLKKFQSFIHSKI
jgi:hypothetical protein